MVSFSRLSIWLPGLALLIFFSAVPLRAKDIGVDVSSLCQFVSQKKVLALRYNYDPKDAKPRILSPYAVGYTKRNDMLLLAYQAEGYSKSGGGEGSGWRNFRTDKISALTDDPGAFIAVKPKRSEYKYMDRFECKNVEVGND
jgi:predicted DNA-binding transcriptional regulator YafY